MAQLTANGYCNYKSELRVQLFSGNPDKQGSRQLAHMNEAEALALIDQLQEAVRVGRAQAALPVDDSGEDSRCETCPMGGPYTCISTD